MGKLPACSIFGHGLSDDDDPLSFVTVLPAEFEELTNW